MAETIEARSRSRKGRFSVIRRPMAVAMGQESTGIGTAQTALQPGRLLPPALPARTAAMPAPRRSRACILLLALACLGGARAAPAQRLVIDAARSHAEFAVRLLWFSHVVGRFEDLQGQVLLGSDDRARVEARIRVASVHMERERHARTLLSPEFFDAARYPEIRFESEPTPAAYLAHGGRLRGQLTLRGATRPVSFRMLPSDCPEPGVRPCTILVHGTVRRSAFGMRSHRTTLSDRVELGLVIVLTPAS